MLTGTHIGRGVRIATSMGTHAVWATATTHVRPAALFGYSPLIGTNIALTSVAVGRDVLNG
jgi:hypothetical protein